MSILCCYKSQSLSVSHSFSISLSLYPFPSCVYIKCIVPGYPCYCSSWSKALIAPLTGGRGEYSNKIHCFVANLNVIIICEKQHSDEFLIIQLIFFSLNIFLWFSISSVFTQCFPCRQLFMPASSLPPA